MTSAHVFFKFKRRPAKLNYLRGRKGKEATAVRV